MVNFHSEAITPNCQTALKHLRQQPWLEGFYLAGGTALALQIGHRISTDLDWFTPSHLLESAEREAVRARLASTGPDGASERTSLGSSGSSAMVTERLRG